MLGAAPVVSLPKATRATAAASHQRQDDTCVFCLEAYVAHVNGLRVECRKPAVVFRLLDFPTVVVHAAGPPALGTGDVRFQRGKSILFKLPQQSFESALSKMPLWCMLVDLDDPERAQLLGSTSVDLSCFANQLNLPPRDSTQGYRKGDFDFGDFMGARVGSMHLVLRLSSLGSALVHHLEALQPPPLDAGEVRDSEKKQSEEKKETRGPKALRGGAPVPTELMRPQQPDERDFLGWKPPPLPVQHQQQETKGGRRRKKPLIDTAHLPPPLFYHRTPPLITASPHEQQQQQQGERMMPPPRSPVRPVGPPMFDSRALPRAEDAVHARLVDRGTQPATPPPHARAGEGSSTTLSSEDAVLREIFDHVNALVPDKKSTKKKKQREKAKKTQQSGGGARVERGPDGRIQVTVQHPLLQPKSPVKKTRTQTSQKKKQKKKTKKTVARPSHDAVVDSFLDVLSDDDRDIFRAEVSPKRKRDDRSPQLTARGPGEDTTGHYAKHPRVRDDEPAAHEPARFEHHPPPRRPTEFDFVPRSPNRHHHHQHHQHHQHRHEKQHSASAAAVAALASEHPLLGLLDVLSEELRYLKSSDYARRVLSQAESDKHRNRTYVKGPSPPGKVGPDTPYSRTYVHAHTSPRRSPGGRQLFLSPHGHHRSGPRSPSPRAKRSFQGYPSPKRHSPSVQSKFPPPPPAHQPTAVYDRYGKRASLFDARKVRLPPSPKNDRLADKYARASRPASKKSHRGRRIRPAQYPPPPPRRRPTVHYAWRASRVRLPPSPVHSPLADRFARASHPAAEQRRRSQYPPPPPLRVPGIPYAWRAARVRLPPSPVHAPLADRFARASHPAAEQRPQPQWKKKTVTTSSFADVAVAAKIKKEDEDEKRRQWQPPAQQGRAPPQSSKGPTSLAGVAIAAKIKKEDEDEKANFRRVQVQQQRQQPKASLVDVAVAAKIKKEDEDEKRRQWQPPQQQWTPSHYQPHQQQQPQQPHPYQQPTPTHQAYEPYQPRPYQQPTPTHQPYPPPPQQQQQQQQPTPTHQQPYQPHQLQQPYQPPQQPTPTHHYQKQQPAPTVEAPFSLPGPSGPPQPRPYAPQRPSQRSTTGAIVTLGMPHNTSAAKRSPRNRNRQLSLSQEYEDDFESFDATDLQ